MIAGRTPAERTVGRVMSLACALLAVFMLVLGGAAHELTHADERGPAQSLPQVVGQAKAPVSTIQLAESAGSKTGAGHSAPLHACSGHCAAHMASEPPILLEVAAPRAEPQHWRVLLATDAPDRVPETSDRPPRA